jgi:hypothetical protein
MKFIIDRTILKVDKKISCSDETITFSEKDGSEITQLHVDALVLNTQLHEEQCTPSSLSPHRHWKVSSCHVFKYFDQNGIHSISSSKDKYSINRIYKHCDGVRRSHAHWVRNPTMCCLHHGGFFIVNALFTYHVILGRKTLYEIDAIIFIPYLKMKVSIPMTLRKKVVTKK